MTGVDFWLTLTVYVSKAMLCYNLSNSMAERTSVPRGNIGIIYHVSWVHGEYPVAGNCWRPGLYALADVARGQQSVQSVNRSAGSYRLLSASPRWVDIILLSNVFQAVSDRVNNKH